MTTPPAHVEVAAFVLGVLDEEEVDIFEGHLAECAGCQAELQELYLLPGLLDESRRAATQPSETVLTDLLDDVAVDRRRRRRQVVSVAAAAAVLLIGVTAPIGRWLWPTTDRSGTVAASSPSSAPGAEILQASNRDTSVSAKVIIERKVWGTRVSIDLYGVRGPLHCQLVVVTTSGRSEVVTSWQVPARHGYGVPGSPEPLRVQGGTAFVRGEIKRFEFRTTTGPNILNVPA